MGRLGDGEMGREGELSVVSWQLTVSGQRRVVSWQLAVDS